MTLERPAVNWLPAGMKALQEHVNQGLLGYGVVCHHTSRSRAGGDLSGQHTHRGIKGRLSPGGEAAVAEEGFDHIPLGVSNQ
jgi:hypothetical protein